MSVSGSSEPLYIEQVSPKFSDYRVKIVIGATVWWLFLALVSRFDMSRLQVGWNGEAVFFILCYFPFCIALGVIGTFKISVRAIVLQTVPSRRLVYSLFWFFIFLFALQCALFLPPALSPDPNTARLEWGFKYVHVLTEIMVRATILICLGDAIVRSRIGKSELMILMTGIVYTLLVVSRSFLLEILIYWMVAGALIKLRKGIGVGFVLKSIVLAIGLICIFLIYGEWRQEADFSIVDYGEMLVNSKALAWIFGYFLVNFDNLALLIHEHFNNGAMTNLFGSLLQTLQLMKFEAVDSYLYVGRFNLGTALRPYVLDFGGWIGGGIFAVTWILTIMVFDYCRYSAHKYVITLMLFYIGFCLPITSRLEQPPYLFVMLFVMLLDFAGRYKIVLYSRTP